MLSIQLYPYPKLTSDFLHLRPLNVFPPLNAVPTPKELAATAKADSQDALAITDAGALYGAIDFTKLAPKKK